VKREDLHCSFCGKLQTEVRKLIAGGGRQRGDRELPLVCICNECIELCADICEESSPKEKT